MCLAVPGRVLEIKGEKATVDFGGVRKEVIVSFLDNLNVGDYILVHVGFAIQKLGKEEAEETLKLWREILEGDM